MRSTATGPRRRIAGQRDQVGRAPVGGERVALEGDAGLGRGEDGVRAEGRAAVREAVSCQASRANVTTPAAVPTSRTSAGRLREQADRDHAGDLVDLASRAPTGSTMSSPCTSRMWLPLSVTNPCAEHRAGRRGAASSPGDLGRAPSGSPRPAAGSVRAGPPASARPRCRRSVREAAATIFSRVSAPPPPLIRCERAGRLVGAVHVDADWPASR